MKKYEIGKQVWSPTIIGANTDNLHPAPYIIEKEDGDIVYCSAIILGKKFGNFDLSKNVLFETEEECKTFINR